MTPDTAPPTSRAISPTVARAVILGAGIAVLGLLIMPWRASPAESLTGDHAYIFTVLLAFVFSAAEFGQVHIEFRRRALSISLSELPMVLGLLMVPPWYVLIARLTGGVITMVIRRRAASRMMFNSGLFITEVCLSASVLYWLTGGNPTPLTSSSWAAVFAAVAAVNAVAMVTVFLAIKWIDDATIEPNIIWTTAASATAAGLLCSALGIMAASVMTRTPFGVILLSIVFISLLLAHRAHHTLITRHRILGRLYSFTKTSAANTSADDVTAVLLQQATFLLHAESAVLRPASWSSAQQLGVPLEEPLVISRSTRSEEHRAWLAKNRLRDAVLVPVHKDKKLFAVLQVSNRLGEVGSFGREDINVLSTLVAHVEVLLHNSELVDRLRRDARQDPLTGLDNRAELAEKLARLFGNSRPGTDGAYQSAASDGPASYGLLILLQVGLYSQVNDALGGEMADMLLQHVAGQLDNGLAENVSIARVGDEQFGVLVPQCASDNEAQDWVAQVRHCLRQPLETQGMSLDVSPIIGYVLLPQDGDSADQALQNAHVALMAARKAPSAEAVSRFDSQESGRSLNRLALAGELRSGISSGEITVVYQPKVSAVHQRVVGFESLARWENPQRGLIMPDEFISLAENTGQLGALTSSVLEQALARASEWLLGYPEVGVSVNLSASQLLDPTLPFMIDSLLRHHQLPAGVLTLEITESRLMAEPEAAHAAMSELRNLGVRLSVDDFGTGYSSLSYLRTLPLDEVKIDKSFIFPLAGEPGNRAIVKSIIDLAHTLGLSVVAEGVETDGIRGLLASDGCDVIQGFLIGRGVAPDAITQWLTSWQSDADDVAWAAD